MKRKLLPSLVAATVLSLSTNALAAGNIDAELQALKQRIAELEAQQATQQAT